MRATITSHAARVSVALLALGAAGCAAEAPTAPRGVGQSCHAVAECESGLTCVDPSETFATSNDAGCMGATLSGIRFCTRACTGDVDCTSLGAGVACSPNGCQTAGFCLRRGDAGLAAGGGDR